MNYRDKYTPSEIELFKLRARLRKLVRALELETVQGNLFQSMSDDAKNELRYEIQRLKNRLARMEKIL